MGPESREPTRQESERREMLLREYGEVCSTFRTLTDIRFRLLGLMPIAAAAAAAFKPEGAAPGRIPFALFGLAATLALVTYNHRNDQLYNELIGRAGAIESELGAPDGAFASRPGAWLSFSLWGLKWVVNHGQAISLIYLASISFWVYMAFEGVTVSLARAPFGWYVADKWVPSIVKPYAGGIGRVVILAAAVCLTWRVARRFKRQEECRAKAQKKAVAEAGAMLAEAERELRNNRPWPPDNFRAPPIPAPEILAYFAAPKAVARGGTVRAEEQKRSKFVQLCANAARPAEMVSQKDQEKVEGSINRYAEMDDAALLCLVRGASGRALSARLLAFLINQPPRWVQSTVAERKPRSTRSEAGPETPPSP